MRVLFFMLDYFFAAERPTCRPMLLAICVAWDFGTVANLGAFAFSADFACAAIRAAWALETVFPVAAETFLASVRAALVASFTNVDKPGIAIFYLLLV
jgi:hypothetical protein